MTKGSMLVVERYAEIAWLVNNYLSDQDYEVKVVSDGPEAVEIASRWLPDVILLDLSLATWHGYELIRRMQKIPAIRNTIMIVVSAASDYDTVIVALQLGVVDYII